MLRLRVGLRGVVGLGLCAVLLTACASPSALADLPLPPAAVSAPVRPLELGTVEAQPVEELAPPTQFPLETPAPVSTPTSMGQPGSDALERLGSAYAARATPESPALPVAETETGLPATVSVPAASPSPTPRPTDAPLVLPTPAPVEPVEEGAATPSDAPPPDRVNDLPFDSFIVMNEAVLERMREIYAKGRSLDRNPRAFSKAGDSTIESPFFLGRFDSSPYNLGAYQFLQPVIDHFQGSYGRKSVAVRVAQHSWTLLNPAWADKQQCQADESPLACEFRINNPSLVILRLGANDAGVTKLFDTNMRKVVEFAIEQGVIPMLSTKPDQRPGTEQNNNLLRQIAADYQIPLWDFERVAQTLPGRGLGADGVHLTGFSQHDYTLPQAFQRGHSVQNLTALIALDKIWRALQ